MKRLRLAVQKKGRLYEESMELLKRSGIHLAPADRALSCSAENYPMDLFFLRDDDIPAMVSQGLVDIGIVGQNEILEKNLPVQNLMNLEFAGCRLSIAVPRKMNYQGPGDLTGKIIATSYPRLLGSFLEQQNIEAEVYPISGSVEIAPAIGLTDIICDLVSSGYTLKQQNMKEVQVLAESSAQMIATCKMDGDKEELLVDFLGRLGQRQSAVAL